MSFRSAMRLSHPRVRRHSEHPFIASVGVLQNGGDREIFTHISRAGAMAPLGTASVGDDSTVFEIFGIESLGRCGTHRQHSAQAYLEDVRAQRWRDAGGAPRLDRERAR